MKLLTRALTVLALASVLVFSAVPAFAHVTVRADTTEPGGFAKYTVRVPTESENAATIRVEIQLPEGYEEARYQPLEGWDIGVSDGVLLIEGGRIEPGEFQEFAFSARNPEVAGDVTFPAIQVYEDGEEVRWVGAAEADEPAPVVTIGGEAAGDSDGGAEASEAAEATEPAESPVVETEPVDTATEPAEEVAAPAPDSAADDQGAGSNVLSIVALIAGLLGLGLGGAAFARTRRTPRT